MDGIAAKRRLVLITPGPEPLVPRSGTIYLPVGGSVTMTQISESGIYSNLTETLTAGYHPLAPTHVTAAAVSVYKVLKAG